MVDLKSQNPSPSVRESVLLKIDGLWEGFFSSKMFLFVGLFFCLVVIVVLTVFHILRYLDAESSPKHMPLPPVPVIEIEELDFYTPPNSKSPVLSSVEDAQALPKSTPLAELIVVE